MISLTGGMDHTFLNDLVSAVRVTDLRMLLKNDYA
jgi:hypothetical protein